MMNNPMQLLSMFRNSTNPMAILQQIANNNPQMRELITNLQGKTPLELENYARNIAKSKGVDLNQFLNQYGISVR
jgi:Flp pilus assembly protein TadD